MEDGRKRNSNREALGTRLQCFGRAKTKVAETFHTFDEEEIAELLPKIKTRQEKQVIKAPVHVKAMIMTFTFQDRPAYLVKKT